MVTIENYVPAFSSSLAKTCFATIDLRYNTLSFKKAKPLEVRLLPYAYHVDKFKLSSFIDACLKSDFDVRIFVCKNDRVNFLYFCRFE